MEESNIDTKIVETATKVIIHSGNARALANKALDIVETSSIDDPQIEELLQKADAEIISAHKTQTEIIQREARGESVQFSMLMTHAQDSLMTAMTELNIIRRMLKLIKVVVKS
jgi:cellobiose PTS system EIIA component